MQTPRFLTPELVYQIAQTYETPMYVYSEKELRDRAREFLAFPSAFGHTVRYAMKANPQKNILKIFTQEGLHIDASSDFEALRALAAGIPAEKIQISSQELGKHARELIEKGVFFVATSLHQLEFFGKNFPGKSCGVRVNPGVGSGAFAKISTGGRSSSFGIWHEKMEEVKKIAEMYHLNITKLHFHIGSENSPEGWVASAEFRFPILEKFPTITHFDMGGGHKMAIMPFEKQADLQAIGNALALKFQDFYEKTGRKIHLEMEPGKYLTINSYSMITEIQDIVDTHDLSLSLQALTPTLSQGERGQTRYAVVGHCCESSDLLTCKLYEAETIETREFPEARIGDYLVVDGVGAYNAGMAIKNYNSFPESGELLLRESGEIVEIRARESVEDIWRNEREVI